MRILKSSYIAACFLVMIILPSVSAANESINLDLPSSADYGERFSVSLELNGFSEGVYDVKIDLLDANLTRIARISNSGEWKSTYYYIDSAINTSISNSQSFDLNITSKYSGTASVNVTLRKGSSAYKFGGYSIEVVYSEPVSEPEPAVIEETASTEVPEDVRVENSTATTEKAEEEAEAKEIPKTPPVVSIKDNESETAEDVVEVERTEIPIEKNDKIRRYSIYLLTGTLFVLAVYLIKLNLSRAQS